MQFFHLQLFSFCFCLIRKTVKAFCFCFFLFLGHIKIIEKTGLSPDTENLKAEGGWTSFVLGFANSQTKKNNRFLMWLSVFSLQLFRSVESVEQEKPWRRLRNTSTRGELCQIYLFIFVCFKKLNFPNPFFLSVKYEFTTRLETRPSRPPQRRGRSKRWRKRRRRRSL